MDIVPADEYQNQFNDFVKEFKNKLGVVYIEDDDWFGTHIFVGIDKDRIEASTIPTSYKGLHVAVVDAYDTLEACELALDLLKDADEEQASYFKRQREFLNSKLTEYENR